MQFAILNTEYGHSSTIYSNARVALIRASFQASSYEPVSKLCTLLVLGYCDLSSTA